MDPDNSQHRNQKHQSKMNKEYRLRSDRKDSFPNGYTEDWSAKPLYSSNKEIKKSAKPRNKLREDNKSILSKKMPSESISIEVKPILTKKEQPGSKMVSLILSTNDSILLNSQNSYDIRFSTGIIEGSGILINETGNIITFENEGSYHFEICGEASLFSDVDVKLVYSSDDFAPDIVPFSEINIPKDEGKLILRGIPTILPLHKGQKIIPRLIPNPDESIVLFAGTRLLIHKVA